jgi:hydantoinase/carbamoylase family amidase
MDRAKTENIINRLDQAKIENITKWIDTLDGFNSTPEYGTTRVLFTDVEVDARNYMKREMAKIGLEITEDAIGNIFATLKGSEPLAAPVWTGSHIDTVLNAGKFDGMAGVVAGLEAVRLIKESGCEHKRDISVVIYTSEEPTRFGACCLGSKALAGMLDDEGAKKLVDQEGKSLMEVLGSLGYDISKFNAIKKKKGDVFAAVELHIEQNNKLELADIPIGIVTGICAPTNYQVVIKGKQSHAGGTSMADRRDAYMASAEIALALEEIIKNTESEYSTGTIGVVEVIPGATNVIPGLVNFKVDIRDSSRMHKDNNMKKFEDKMKAIAEKRKLRVEWELENNDTPVACDEQIINTIEAVCKNQGVKYQKMISGAYHDSMMLGYFAPTGMIFVPSQEGISHSPDEWTDYEDIGRGTDILAETLLKLSNQ